jgi:predicted anti-sigma-YlaC factor YlaD
MLLTVEERKCIRARRMFSLALDGEATPSGVLVATTHIASCEGCRRYARRVVVLTNELRSVRPRLITRKTTHQKGERP